MTDLLTVVPSIVAIIVAGWALDHVARFDLRRLGVGMWPARAFLTVAVLCLASINAILLVLVFTACVAHRLRGELAVAAREPIDRGDAHTLAATVAVALVALMRPRGSIYWDEFIWLSKSRIELTHFGALRAAALSPDSTLIPRGYTLLWSELAAWLAAPFARAPLSFTAAIVTVTAAAAFLASTRMLARSVDANDRSSAWIAAIGLIATPLLFVHLRSAYADLTLGLLVATLALTLARPGLPLAAGCVLAIVATGLKDEGIVHVFAVTLVASAFALRDRRGRDVVRAAIAFIAALVPFVSWRALIAMHGVAQTQHHFEGCDVRETVPLLHALVEHVIDLRTWGMLWPFSLGLVVALGSRRSSRRTPEGALGATALLQIGVLTVGLTCGAARDRAFAFDGSLLNRAMVQIAPMTLAMIALAVVRMKRPGAFGARESQLSTV